MAGAQFKVALSQDMNVRTYDYGLFAGSIKEPIQLLLRDSQGKTKKHTVYRVKSEMRSKKLVIPAFEYKILADSIAYVAFNSFSTDSAENAFIAHFEEISKSKAIIFDIRNNGGGTTPWRTLRYLIQQPQTIHKWYTRDYKPAFRAWGRKQETYGGQNTLAPNDEFIYDKPVIVLTSARTFSAAEDFAGAFRSLNRGLLIGEATGGSTGQPLTISLPGNLTARICTKRDMFGNGEDFVGKVIPDISVAPTVSDVRNGRDPVLEAAILELTGDNK